MNANALYPRMQAIEIVPDQAPEKSALRLCERPLPDPGPGEVLIKVVCAGVNRPDILQRQGLYPAPAGASDLPGLEVSGIVVARAADVIWPHLDEPVCALLDGGGYAEYCTANASLCMPIPRHVSLEDAAGIPETLLTVWHNLIERAQLQTGEKLLVHGGSSGIGVMAIQLARFWGAEVFVTAGSDEKCRFCSALGATAIHYHEQDFVEALQTLTHGKGVNVILDMIGGDYFPRNLKLLADEGRLMQIGVQHGFRADINLLALLLKRVTLSGSTLRTRPIPVKAAIVKAAQAALWAHLGLEIKPIIYTRMPMKEAALAHALMESSAHMGKILIYP